MTGKLSQVLISSKEALPMNLSCCQMWHALFFASLVKQQLVHFAMGSNGLGDDKSCSRIRLVYLHYYNALNIILQQEAIFFIHIRKKREKALSLHRK